MTAIVLTRIFRMGATSLADPDPALSPEQVIALYTPSYPHLRSATISEPERVGDTLVYTLSKPTVQTKGRRDTGKAVGNSDKEVEDAIASLDAWSATSKGSGVALSKRWAGVHQFIKNTVMHRKPSLDDAFLLPMA